MAALDDYDWEQVFGAAGEESAYGRGEPSVVAGDDAHAGRFTRENVVSVLAMENGENDGPSWIGVFKLDDGRWAFLEGSCDYTGWD